MFLSQPIDRIGFFSHRFEYSEPRICTYLQKRLICQFDLEKALSIFQFFFGRCLHLRFYCFASWQWSSDCVRPMFLQLPSTGVTTKEQRHSVLYCYHPATKRKQFLPQFAGKIWLHRQQKFDKLTKLCFAETKHITFSFLTFFWPWSLCPPKIFLRKVY